MWETQVRVVHSQNCSPWKASVRKTLFCLPNIPVDMKKLCVTAFMCGVLWHDQQISNFLVSGSWGEWLHSLMVLRDRTVVPRGCQASPSCSWQQNQWFSQCLVLQGWPLRINTVILGEDSSKSPLVLNHIEIKLSVQTCSVVFSYSSALTALVAWGSASHLYLHI